MITEVKSANEDRILQELAALFEENSSVVVYLSRRNLLTLIKKLDANIEKPGTSKALLVKRDNEHPTHPQSHSTIYVQAVEDSEYYTDREPGKALQFPVRSL